MDHGHRQLEHTADVAVELWAPDEAGLLREGASAIIELLCGSARVDCREQRRIELSTLDREDRLVQWLNEVLYLASVDGFLVGDADFELRGKGLAALVQGEPNARHRLSGEIKSATYHDLRIEEHDGGLLARVVLDV